MLKRIVFLAFIGLFLASCNNEVDLNDEYQEITVVYGLLNPKETRHYIKITKAFQADGNIYIASQDPTQSEFVVPREVWMDEYINENYIRSIPFDTLTIQVKDSGIFYYPTQIIYATAPNVALAENAEYRLFIKNKSTGKVIKSSTTTIQELTVLKPGFSATTANLVNEQDVSWRSVPQGKLYQLTIRFFYQEVANGVITHKHIDQTFETKRSKNTLGGEVLILTIANNSFYENLARNMTAPPFGVVRYVDSLQYIFDVANEDFTVYMDVNKPSNSIVQERPPYTNIIDDNGGNSIGLFASRANKIRNFQGLAQKSLDTLIYGSITSHLGFQKKLK